MAKYIIDLIENIDFPPLDRTKADNIVQLALHKDTYRKEIVAKLKERLEIRSTDILRVYITWMD